MWSQPQKKMKKEERERAGKGEGEREMVGGLKEVACLFAGSEISEPCFFEASCQVERDLNFPQKLSEDWREK